MDRYYFVKRIVLKEYIKSMLVVITLLVLGLSSLTNMTVKTNKRELEGNLKRRNSTLRNNLGNDVASSLRWISIYREIGILDDLLEESIGEASIKKIIDKLAKSNTNINEITIFNSKGKRVKRHYKSNSRRDNIGLPTELEGVTLLEDRKKIFIDAEVHSEREFDFYFYVPIIKKDGTNAYVGISYGLDSFFHQFKNEFRDIFDTKNLGILHKKGVNKSKFFSIDVDKDQIGEVVQSKVKATNTFNIGRQFEEKLSPYFNEIILSSRFTNNGLLTSYVPINIMELKNRESVKRYFVYSALILVGLAVFLWFYIGERIEKIENFKKLKIYNTKLRKTLETKDMLFSIIGHDLRSPFTSQLGYFQLLQRKFDTYEKKEIKTIIDIMSVNSGKLSILTENILRWAAIHNKKIEYRPENIRLKDIIEEYEDIFKMQLANKDINLEIDIIEDSTVKSDKNLLEASIRNLISNAIKYSRKGGSIKILGREKNEYMSLSIEDEGTGIAKEVKPYVLKGNQVSTAGTYNEKGIGLGLYVVREFTKINRGKVYFESEEGKGTKFTLLIPKV